MLTALFGGRGRSRRSHRKHRHCPKKRNPCKKRCECPRPEPKPKPCPIPEPCCPCPSKRPACLGCDPFTFPEAKCDPSSFSGRVAATLDCKGTLTISGLPPLIPVGVALHFGVDDQFTSGLDGTVVTDQPQLLPCPPADFRLRVTVGRGPCAVVYTLPVFCSCPPGGIVLTAGCTTDGMTSIIVTSTGSFVPSGPLTLTLAVGGVTFFTSPITVGAAVIVPGSLPPGTVATVTQGGLEVASSLVLPACCPLTFVSATPIQFNPNTTFVFGGANPGEVINYTLPGSDPPVSGTVVADASGNISVPITCPLEDGVTSIVFARAVCDPQTLALTCPTFGPCDFHIFSIGFADNTLFYSLMGPPFTSYLAQATVGNLIFSTFITTDPSGIATFAVNGCPSSISITPRGCPIVTFPNPPCTPTGGGGGA